MPATSSPLGDQGSGPGADPVQRFPWQLGLSALSWIGLGILLLVLGIGSAGRSTTDADPGSVGQVRDALGASYAESSRGGVPPFVLLFAGLVIVLLTFLLLIRQNWARHVLTVCGAIVVVVLALGGRWETIVAMVALALGAIPLLSRSVTRYLSS